MSVQATTWAWSIRDLPTHLRLTLLAIADACNADGFGYPGQGRLAEMCECSDRQVRNNLNALIERGLIQVQIRAGDGTGRHSNAYQLGMPQERGNRKSSTRQPEVQYRGATGSPEGGNRKSSVGQPEIAVSYERQIERQKNKRGGMRALRDAPAPTPRDTKKGTRLSLEGLPDDWRDWCATKRPDLDPNETFEDFADYWRSKPGKEGVKLDWLATWRRWVRNQKAPRTAVRGPGNRPEPPHGQGSGPTDAEVRRAAHPGETWEQARLRLLRQTARPR